MNYARNIECLELWIYPFLWSFLSSLIVLLLLFGSARHSAPSLHREFLNKSALFADAHLKGIYALTEVVLDLARIAESLWVAWQEVLYFCHLGIDLLTLSAPVHERLLVGENWLFAWIILALFNMETSLVELILNRVKVFSVTKSHSYLSISSADILDGILLYNSINNVLSTCNSSQIATFSIGGEPWNNQLIHWGVVPCVCSILLVSILTEKVACEILNLCGLRWSLASDLLVIITSLGKCGRTLASTIFYDLWLILVSVKSWSQLAHLLVERTVRLVVLL